VSGKPLKTFRGHASYVNEAIFSADGSLVYSASSDGTVKAWDVKTSECTQTLKPITAQAADITINTICWLPKVEHLIVCNRSPSVYRMTTRGDVVRVYSSGKDKGADFISTTTSPRGEWLYAVSEDMHLYCFRVDSGELVHRMKVSDKELIGLAHHPHKNLLATYADDGTVQLWKP